jgi:hypothetical protein
MRGESKKYEKFGSIYIFLKLLDKYKSKNLILEKFMGVMDHPITN